MGRVQKNIADEYYAIKAVWLADINLDVVEELARGKSPLFSPLPVYPAVRRDITIICPASMQIDTVEKAIVNAKGKLFHSVEFRDIYVPSDSEERNLTFRLTFQSEEKTLEDKDVDKEREKIASSVVNELGVRI
jgi:phenylalanyl-tRNA synthetase beta chain